MRLVLFPAVALAATLVLPSAPVLADQPVVHSTLPCALKYVDRFYRMGVTVTDTESYSLPQGSPIYYSILRESRVLFSGQSTLSQSIVPGQAAQITIIAPSVSELPSRCIAGEISPGATTGNGGTTASGAPSGGPPSGKSRPVVHAI